MTARYTYGLVEVLDVTCSSFKGAGGGGGFVHFIVIHIYILIATMILVTFSIEMPAL